MGATGMEMQALGMGISITHILIAIISTIGTVIAAVAVALVNTRIHDAQLRGVLANAINNAVGAVQQGANQMIQSRDPRILRGVIPDNLAPGVQYVMDHAGEAVKRFGVSPERIADKITAKIGLEVLNAGGAIPGASVDARNLNLAELDRIRREMGGGS